SAQQCSIVVAELQRLSARNSLRLTSVSRDAGALVLLKTASPSDIYEIAFEGPYLNSLAALEAIDRLPLVANVKVVTFERLAHRRRPEDNVRTRIQLEVFRMLKIDASTPS
ncbi:MAG: hypothetical protein ACRENA_06210, partial [Vulcanimicrobiaceae bacterium]